MGRVAKSLTYRTVYWATWAMGHGLMAQPYP